MCRRLATARLGDDARLVELIDRAETEEELTRLFDVISRAETVDEVVDASGQ